jgi:hypothetical protein
MGLKTGMSTSDKLLVAKYVSRGNNQGSKFFFKEIERLSSDAFMVIYRSVNQI